jgi:hypothetical protein
MTGSSLASSNSDYQNQSRILPNTDSPILPLEIIDKQFFLPTSTTQTINHISNPADRLRRESSDYLLLDHYQSYCECDMRHSKLRGW